MCVCVRERWRERERERDRERERERKRVGECVIEFSKGKIKGARFPIFLLLVEKRECD